MPVLSDILAQPDTLTKVAYHQLGDGLPAIKRASELIKEAPKVVFSAIGASYNACIPIVHQLHAMGLNVQLFDAAEFLYNPEKSDLTNSVYILVSRSGESVEIVKLLNQLKRNKATVIGVANEDESYLVQKSDCAIIVHSPVDHSVAIQTYSSTMLIQYLLFEILVAERQPENLIDEVQSIASLLSEIVNNYKHLSSCWYDFFTSAKTIYLLGRGASLATAYEGALLFHEMAKVPAIGMGSGTFRHGTVEVVDETFRGIIFISNGVTRSLDEALAKNLVNFGGQLYMVGECTEQVAAEYGLDCWEIGTALPGLYPILEVIPVQLAAYRLAGWRGFTPGEFKYLGSVVDDEARF